MIGVYNLDTMLLSWKGCFGRHCDECENGEKEFGKLDGVDQMVRMDTRDK